MDLQFISDEGCCARFRLLAAGIFRIPPFQKREQPARFAEAPSEVEAEVEGGATSSCEPLQSSATYKAPPLLTLTYADAAWLRGRPAFMRHSRITFGKKAAKKIDVHTTISIPGNPRRKMGGIGIKTRATVNTIANG
jgi:hypothetical protein